MRRRIYWLLPGLASARRAMDELLLARIEEGHIHFVAADGTDMSGLHAANVFQTSDLIPAAQSGLVIGGAVGALAGVAAALYPIVGDSPQWGVVGVLAIAGGVFGAWASSMLGSSAPNRRLRRFQDDIAQGRILLMVDVPRSRLEDVEDMLERRHPEGHFEGVEPDIPAFP
jgi:hypothetical protein